MIIHAAKFIWWLYVLLVNRSLIPYVAINGLLDYQHSCWLAAGGGYSGADIQTVATKKTPPPLSSATGTIYVEQF